MSKRVLLTGGQGFTGFYVGKALSEAGFEVFNLDRSGKDEHHISANLLDKPSLTALVERVQPDYVIHLAAVAFVGHGSISDFYMVNVEGTLNLLQAIREKAPTVKRVILASSANVYGNPPISPVAETSPFAPLNHYAMSKVSMEYMARTIYGADLPLLFTRPFNYTGVGQSPDFLIPKIVHHFKEGLHEMSLGNLDVVREFNDVRTIAKAYVALLQVGEPTQAVNLCSGQGYTITALLKICEQLTGHQLQVKVNPQFVRPNELKVLVGDSSLLRSLVSDLTFPPIEKTLSWMLSA